MNISISRVIYAGSTAIIALILAMIYFGSSGLSSVASDFQLVTRESMPRLIALADISRAMDVARIKQGLQVTGDGVEDARSVDQDITDNIAKADKGIEEYRRLPTDPTEVAIMNKVISEWATLRQQTMQVRDMALAGDISGAKALYRGPMVAVAVDLRKTINSQIAFNKKLALSRAQDADNVAQAASTRMVMAGGIGLLMALAVAMALRQRALVPIQQLVAAMRMMAGGNLDHPIPGADRRDEVGDISTALEEIKQAVATSSAAKAERDMAEQKQIVDAFVKALDELAQQNLEYRITQDFPPQYMGLRNNYNAAVASLAQALSGVRVGTSSLVATIAEIQSAANDLAMRNSRQAANVEETTAGMQAVVSGARETAHGSAEARIQAHSALTKAEQGGDVVTRAVEAMGAIESSSSEIRQIIAVIDGIAFQTNLLALNAGVEAARAGDAGKGFAVVANEVRALAQRSADAAKDIRGLIEISTQHVQGGVDLVKQTGTLLTDILQDVTAISHTITNIADKAGEQENTLIQVNASMLDIDQVTQQNAAMVEQTNAAAQNMASEANALSRLVSTFRTRDVATRPDVGGTQNRRTSLLSGGAKPASWAMAS